MNNKENNIKATKKTLIDTYMIISEAENTGLLSKLDKNIKQGLNPLTTILNKDFDNEFKRKYMTRNISMEYIQEKQHDIIRLFKEYYNDNDYKE